VCALWDLQIRKVLLSDARGICEIYNQAIVEGGATFETEVRTESDIHALIQEHDEGHPILVAVMDNEVDPGQQPETIVGWASISTYRPRSCYSGIGEFSFYVREEFRGRGAGKKLMISLIEESKRRGYWKLLSRIFPSNFISRSLCKSCGFREVGTYEKHGKLNGKWIDTIIVERLIPENLT
jgi:L-amino acid N-acyltransferase YncA